MRPGVLGVPVHSPRAHGQTRGHPRRPKIPRCLDRQQRDAAAPTSLEAKNSAPAHQTAAQPGARPKRHLQHSIEVHAVTVAGSWPAASCYAVAVLSSCPLSMAALCCCPPLSHPCNTTGGSFCTGRAPSHVAFTLRRRPCAPTLSERRLHDDTPQGTTAQGLVGETCGCGSGQPPCSQLRRRPREEPARTPQ